MKVLRMISVYEKIGDKLIVEINIDNISIIALKHIISYDVDDPNLYKLYKITAAYYNKLVKLVPELSKFDLDTVEMFLECYQARS